MEGPQEEQDRLSEKTKVLCEVKNTKNESHDVVLGPVDFNIQKPVTFKTFHLNHILQG